MYSVDRAAREFFRLTDFAPVFFLTQPMRSRIADALPWIKIFPKHRSFEFFGDIVYRRLASPRQLQKYSRIIYWGDYLNNPAYGYGNFANNDLLLGNADTLEMAQDRWDTLFTLRDHTLAGKILSVGCNFQSIDTAQPRQIRAVETMLANFHSVLPRDPVSTSVLRRLSGPAGDSAGIVQQGMDCAFLQTVNPRSASARGPYFCYAFGRSNFAGLSEFIARLEKTTGLKAVPLEGWLSLPRVTASKKFNRMVEAIGSATFVVTDIYHLSINSILRATPTFCLGRQSDTQEDELSDFKKFHLFQMLGLADYYFQSPSGTDDSGFLQNVTEEVTLSLETRTKEFPGVAKSIGSMINDFSQRLLADLE
jgi:hypothetical protein